ncbi:hypothetical protein KIM372_07740 [Bombiscardovia nodaiensis]|uniref:Septum formation initiator n=1 Tax=Bombiscardovia nodaiensis TaxID=2932181 RepID=A0ABN6SCA9_9BIFI|nr:hypothetical protein KIM372_07740 [Bombiscardovia nodaiensis]
MGAIQLVSTFHTYAINLSELNGLKNQQAVLVEQKQQLENDIARWDDRAYVTAQARERLGFVFPGEQAIRVLHPEAVTGGQPSAAEQKKDSQRTVARPPLPWYREMAYSLSRADAEPTAPSTSPKSDSTSQDTPESSGQGTTQETPNGSKQAQ